MVVVYLSKYCLFESELVWLKMEMMFYKLKIKTGDELQRALLKVLAGSRPKILRTILNTADMN